MERRRFLQIAALSAGAVACAPKAVLASQGCMAPVMTPFGTIQRCTAGIDSFKFQRAIQQRSEWCWAACISMIFNYYSHPVSQDRIVTETWGKIINMPAQPADIMNDLNRDWTDDNNVDFTSVADAFFANNYNAVADLQNDDPLIVGALGHATVLTAMTSDINLQSGAWQVKEAIVRDPWPANPAKRALSPVEWFHIGFAARVRIS